MQHRLVGAVIIAVVFSVGQESEFLRRSVMVGADLQETGASTGAAAAGDKQIRDALIAMMGRWEGGRRARAAFRANMQ